MTASLTASLDELWSAWTDEQCRAAEAPRFDYALARRIAAGDMSAFEELCTRYHRRLYSLYVLQKELRPAGAHDP